MKQTAKYILLFTIVTLAATTRAGAQSTNSPYTRYGYGQLSDNCFAQQGMGGANTALRSPSYINPANPASFSSADSTSFIFDMGVSGLLSNFKSQNGYNNKFTANLDYLAIQFPVTKWMGMSAGLTPYSHVGYNFYLKDSIQLPGDTSHNRYTQSYYGTGSINQVYLGLAFNIARHLSLGVSGYYMFGTLNNYKSLGYTSSSLTTATTVENSALHVSAFNARFGLQYHETIGRKHAFTIGAIYEFKSQMGGDLTTTTESLDTIRTNSDALFDNPSIYGAGLSYTFDRRLTVAADYSFAGYADARFFGKTDSLINRHKVAVGAEYIHNPTGRKYIDRVYWRLGANYRNSYAKINGLAADEMSVTCGVGLPLRTSRSLINVNFEYGRIGVARQIPLKENYFRLALNFTLNEVWFLKTRIN